MLNIIDVEIVIITTRILELEAERSANSKLVLHPDRYRLEQEVSAKLMALQRRLMTLRAARLSRMTKEEPEEIDLKLNPGEKFEPVDKSENNPALAALKYAVENRCDEPMAFLTAWYHGEFQSLREEWDDVPDEVFDGADPLFKKP